MAYYLNRFFLGGEINSFQGIKSLRYRVLYILEPVFFIIAFISSIFVQISLLKSNYDNFLLLYYLSQFLLIILSTHFFKLNRVNRSYFLFILLLFSLFTFLSLYDFSLYLWLGLMYLDSDGKYETESLFGIGIVGMAVLLGVHWVILKYTGIKDE